MTVAIRATDRVRDVLARDPALLDVLIAQSPRFAMLRKPAIRRTAAALATVEQAATVAGIPAAALVSALNDAIGAPEAAIPTSSAPAPAPVQSVASRAARPLDRRIVEVDVRDELRAKREPFPKIMAAVRTLDDDTMLRVRATFEPAPLVSVLGVRGFTCETEQHDVEDWSLWAWRDHAATPAAPAEPRPDAITDQNETPPVAKNEVWIDVRDLEPPEPMMRTLAALETLPAGHVLIHMNTRVPQFLLPMLVERGFVYEIEHLDSGNVLVRIRQANDLR
jgi:uncharacterized protein (DUF2249 family)